MERAPYPLTVLIVDDNCDAAESLARYVWLSGHTVQTAHTPTEAVIATDEDPPDAVLMDIGIPGMDGYRLARKICDRLTRRPLLVAITGYTGLAVRSRAEKFDHHFLKPVEPSEIVTVLNAHAKRLAE